MISKFFFNLNLIRLTLQTGPFPVIVDVSVHLTHLVCFPDTRTFYEDAKFYKNPCFLDISEGDEDPRVSCQSVNKGTVLIRIHLRPE